MDMICISNWQLSAVLVPETNERPHQPLIVPDRFNSTSELSAHPIVTPELGSISEPRSTKDAPCPIQPEEK